MSSVKAPLAALDVGLRRIGLAVSPDGHWVLPVSPVLRRNRDQAAADVSDLLRSRGIVTLVVGVPIGGASEEEMGRRIRHFVGLLAFDGDVVYQDEYGTSAEVSEKMKGAGRHPRDGTCDSLAAALILERFLEKFTITS